MSKQRKRVEEPEGSKRRRRRRAPFCLAAGLGLGFALSIAASCVAEPEETAASYGALLEYVMPERLVPVEVWQVAPPSCGGALVDDLIHIRHAAGAPGLGVVLDDAGHAICVDTWDAIHIEISRVQGDPSPDPMSPVERPLDVPESTK